MLPQHEQKLLPLYYNAADVCVVPSYYESFGLVALEAMACGTPVVATRVGGLSTIIHHGHTGYLKSWRCPEAFANSVEMIISTEDLQQSMGAAARIKGGGKILDLAFAQAGDRLLVLSAGHSALLPRARRHHTLNAGRQAARLDLRPWPLPLPLPDGVLLPDSKNRR